MKLYNCVQILFIRWEYSMSYICVQIISIKNSYLKQ